MLRTKQSLHCFWVGLAPDKLSTCQQFDTVILDPSSWLTSGTGIQWNSKLACAVILSGGAGGVLIGLAFGVAVRWLLRFLRRRDAGRDQQICLTLAAAYLSFYIANSPAQVSGKIVRGVACTLSLLPPACRLLYMLV